MTCYWCIEENLLRAVMVQAIEEYRWSRYHHNSLGIEDELITPLPLYNTLALAKEEQFVFYKKLFDTLLYVKMIELFNDSAEKGNVLGDEGYHNRIEHLFSFCFTGKIKCA